MDAAQTADPGPAAGPVVITGLMGSGKTSVARLVAHGLDRTLRDSDPDIEADQGRTAGQIAAAEGADALHEIEGRHLLGALAQRPPVVVAAAASTIERADCRAGLAGAFVVWLDAPDELLARRWSAGPHRPRFGPDVLAMLDAQGRRRRPLFAEVADLSLDTSGSTPEKLAAVVVDAVAGPRGARPATAP